MMSFGLLDIKGEAGGLRQVGLMVVLFRLMCWETHLHLVTRFTASLFSVMRRFIGAVSGLQ